ncbi:MAG: PepSY domain-containing protein [Candidatus Aminicenantes bacterium]|nr:PepSY domain-containing protein [Candidatus Aminicenantes bacterium]
MKNFAKVLGAVLVLSLILPVVGGAQDKEKSEGNVVSDAKALAAAAKVTMAAALDKALKAAPGTALAAELEQEENTLIFTFDILPKLTSKEITEIHVDAKTGAVIKAAEETEKEEAEGKEAEEAEGAEEPSIADMQSMAKMAKVTMAAALRTALKAAPGTVIVVELENEDNALIFSFDILPSPSATEITEIHVDAKTGLVIKTEKEK